VPLNVGQNNLLWWNKNVFRKYGVKEPPYKTWDEFFAVAEEFKKKAPDVAFFAEGLQPGWYILEKALWYAGHRYGIDFYERIMNGKAMGDDFEGVLKHMEQLLAYSNEDHASLNGIAANQVITSQGDAALTLQGLWGVSPFSKANMTLDVDYSMTQAPGEDIFIFVANGYVVFKDAPEDQKKAALAIAIASLLKETQIIVNPTKGGVPGRTDIDPETFPSGGRADVAKYSARYIKKAQYTAPRAVGGLPPVVKTEYAPPLTGYLTGSITLDKAVQDMLKVQETHQDKFGITWDF
jgi:ABC-type glycerol-3-phosphate transport system substrate-binding protein